MPMDDTSGTSMGAPGPGAMPMASASPPSASIATAPVVSAPTAPVIAAASAPTTEEDISLQSLGAQADEQGVLEILSENGTDPITVRNLEPGDSCNDDCLHAKFEALERMQLRLNSSLEPVTDRGMLHAADSREKLVDFKGRLFKVEDVIEGRGGSDTGLIGQVNEVKPAGVSIGKLLDSTMSNLFDNLKELQKNGAQEIRLSKDKFTSKIDSVQESVDAMLKRIGNNMVVNSYGLDDAMGRRVKAATNGVAASQRSSVRDVAVVDRGIAKTGRVVDKSSAEISAGLDDAGDDIKEILSKGQAGMRTFNVNLIKDLDQMTLRERAVLNQKVKAAKRAGDIRVEQEANQMQGKLSRSSQFFNTLTADAQKNFTAEIAAAGIGLEGVGKLNDKALSDLFEKMQHGMGRLSQEDARAVLAQNRITLELQKDIGFQEELVKRMGSTDADALSKIWEALGQDSATAEKVLMMMAKGLEGDARSEANSIEADLAAVALKSREGALAFEQALSGDTTKLRNFIRELEVKLKPEVEGAGKALRNSEGVVEGNLRDVMFRKEEALKSVGHSVSGRIEKVGYENAKTRKANIERGKEALSGIMGDLSSEKSSDLKELLESLKEDDQAHNELLALIGTSSVDALKDIRYLGKAIRGSDVALTSNTVGMNRLKQQLVKLAGRGNNALGALSTLLTQMAARNEEALKTQWARSTVISADSRKDVSALLNRLVDDAKRNTTAKIPDLLRAFIQEVRDVEASSAQTKAIVAASDDDVRRLGAKLQANRAEMEISKNRLAQTMGSLLQHVDASDSKYLLDLADQSTKWSRYTSDQMKHYLDTETKALLDRSDMEGVSAQRMYATLSDIQHKLTTGDAQLDARLMSEESELTKESEAHKKKMVALGKHFIDTMGEDSEEVKDLHKKLSRVVSVNGQAIADVTRGLQHGLRNITAAMVRHGVGGIPAAGLMRLMQVKSAMGVKHDFLYGQEVLRKMVEQLRAVLRIREQAEHERRIKEHTNAIMQLVALAKRQEAERAQTEGKSDKAQEQNANQVIGVADIIHRLMVATGAVDNSELSGTRAVEGDMTNVTQHADAIVGDLRGDIAKGLEEARKAHGKGAEEVGYNLRGSVANAARKSGNLDHEMYDMSIATAQQARSDGSHLAENARDLESAAGTVAMFGHVSGNELRALSHNAHASNEAMQREIARTHGVNLDRVSRLDDVVKTFVTLTEGFMNETKETVNGIRHDLNDATRLSSEQLSHSSIGGTEIAKSATARAHAILQAIEDHRATSKTISGELRRRLTELEALSIEMDRNQIVQQNGVEAMLADAREKVVRSQGDIKKSVHDWIRDATSRYTQQLIDAS
ncbi:Rootletin, putative [Perkinsus marinus ATCC 50983]|uniref:Rootletin, putative n=1 Tax=Perkinsus marinus (strain ATCC 50983 / TXsc) TaxID=423536 RepID=C5KT13_PERM5|nr:Rootletin, putative [Perkinsus marinus ATCC 50983]EER12363.1 Rootletin, putative [Perkinsus marinus ATCC 50983]|eukprot:XP_002780568.1 Rootletin, putative [Perkinsus marinus ATCC 50983]